MQTSKSSNNSNRQPSSQALTGRLISLAERGKLPDSIIRFGIRHLCQKRLRQEQINNPETQQQRFQLMIEQLRQSPVAIETDAANEQHYEVPTEFYLATLGKNLKYSCAYYENIDTTLDQAEDAMLSMYCVRAKLEDHQTILELGCGWGSLTLWMAATYPSSQITAVSNSSTQKQYIDRQCQQRGLTNVVVVTSDMNALDLPNASFDRILSVEMFEHMRNYRTILKRVSHWLKNDGKLFVHLFAHRNLMYPFEPQSEEDWMSTHFFTGGLMPSVDTLLHFQEHLNIESRWLVNGTHYQRTCNHWLAKTDQHATAVQAAFRESYGSEELARLWFYRWRIFYMACAELFGLKNGTEWMVAHYLFAKPD